MEYVSKSEAVSDIGNSARAYLGLNPSQATAFGPVDQQDIQLLAESENEDGITITQIINQPIYTIRDTGVTYLGRLRPEVREYLVVKNLIENESLTGTVEEVKEAIETKVVRKLQAENISLRSLQVAVGLQKWSYIKGVLDAIVDFKNDPYATDDQISASIIVEEVLDALNPDKERLTVDPTTDEFRNQVTAIKNLVQQTVYELEISKGKTAGEAGVISQNAFTDDDEAKMKSLGEELWIVQKRIKVRDWQLSNILGV